MISVVVAPKLCRGPASQPVVAVFHRCFSQDVSREDIKNMMPVIEEGKFPTPAAAAAKRGTGGRSSFNGTVATVFGGTGQLGAAVVNRLAKVGTQIIAPYRGDPYYIRNLKLAGDLGQVLFLPFYLRDDDSIRKAMKYSNVVINCIGKESETASFTFDEVHVEGARRLARIARESGVQRFIHVSALGCTPNPKPVILRNGSGFMRSKWYGEQAVREEFPDAIIFRPSEIYGPRDRFLTYYAKFERRSYLKICLWKKGKGVYKMPVYVSDVAQGIANSVFDNFAPGKTFDAAGPRKYEMWELVNFFNRCVNRDERNGWLGVKDLRLHPWFFLRVYWYQIMRKYPQIHMEKLEKENCDEVTTPGNPTLEDLGVKLMYLEEKAPYLLKFYDRYGWYEPEFGEEAPPEPPKFVTT